MLLKTVDTAQRGKHTIIFFMVLIVVLSLAARLTVRHIMKASHRSRKAKKKC